MSIDNICPTADSTKVREIVWSRINIFSDKIYNGFIILFSHKKKSIIYLYVSSYVVLDWLSWNVGHYPMDRIIVGNSRYRNG